MSIASENTKDTKKEVLILIILEVLYEFMTASLIPTAGVVLILIILEVLYEIEYIWRGKSFSDVLILIILEVLYETDDDRLDGGSSVSLNPYYTGSTL